MHSTLSIVKDRFEQILPRLPKGMIKHIYTSGSVARNEYYPGWSDVDINVVAEGELDYATLVVLNEFCHMLTNDLSCKVGIDFIPHQNVVEASACGAVMRDSPEAIACMKNYHVANRAALKRGTLFVAEDYDVPSIRAQDFVGLSMSRYAEQLVVQVHETRMRCPDSNQGRLLTLRIITKACLYLLQTFVLSKDGELIVRYSELPQKVVRYYPHDLTLLVELYGLLERNKEGVLIERAEEYLPQIYLLFVQILGHVRAYS